MLVPVSVPVPCFMPCLLMCPLPGVVLWRCLCFRALLEEVADQLRRQREAAAAAVVAGKASNGLASGQVSSVASAPQRQ